MNSTTLTFLRRLARAPVRVSDRLPLCLYVAGVSGHVPAMRHAQKANASGLRKLLSECAVDERHFVASTLYSVLIGKARRRELAAFFTPPRIVELTIQAAIRAGLDLRRDTVIDPAAGGAAFLSSLAGRMRDAGVSAADALSRLKGVEIDPDLAKLASRLVLDRFSLTQGPSVVRCADGLTAWGSGVHGIADAVLANPPYGRLTGRAKASAGDLRDLVSPGHINRYVLFSGLAVQLVKPGGVVALVIPSSFLAGPMFAPFRQFVRAHCQVLALDIIEERDRTFLDVSQDTCILILRKTKRALLPRNSPDCALIRSSGERILLPALNLPSELGQPWGLPHESAPPAEAASVTLAAYGARVRSGYFVWNRETARMRRDFRSGCVPLVWAKNIQPGKPCVPAARDGGTADFVFFEHGSPAIVREHALLLQRTTNSRQPRRIIVAPIDASVLRRYGGFVSENHTIVLTADGSRARLDLLLKVLGTGAVDTHFRRLSTGSHVSVAALRSLPLPDPDRFEQCLAELGDPEKAAAEAYRTAPTPRVAALFVGGRRAG